MTGRRGRWTWLWLACLITAAGCTSLRQPILIGFAGELTGQRGDLGVEGRDGAQLAVDTINAAGGVQGRPLKLLVRDDQGEPETARQVDAELVDAGVVAIIGHMTSGQTAAVLEQLNRDQVVLISPTATSVEFSGRDDYFFRVAPDTDWEGQALARHIYQEGVRRVSGVYDLSNQVYSERVWQAIQTGFEALGGEVGPSFTFTSGQTDLRSLMSRLLVTRPEAVVLIASAVDAALLAQYLRGAGCPARLFATPWANTEELLAKGGRAVEALDLVSLYNAQNPFPAFQPFVQQFETRYRRTPAYGAAYAYEAVLVLVQALNQTQGRREGLREALKAVQDLEGVQGRISLDACGDVRRRVYIARVVNGQFRVIDTLEPAD